MLSGYVITSRIPTLRAGPTSHDSHMTSVKLSFKFYLTPHMTFDLWWPWPWPPITIGGSRATPDASLVKISAGVSEIWWWPWNDLCWPWLNSPANFKILPPSDLWPWMTLTPTPYNHQGSRVINGVILVKIGAGVLEWLRNIHTYIHTYAATSRELGLKKKKLFGCPPPSAPNLWKLEKNFNVQKYTAPNFQNSKKDFFFLWKFWSFKNNF